MNISKRKILFSIYPNSRGYGFVYMENASKLIDFGVVSISPINNRFVMKRVTKALKYFRPSIIITLDPDAKNSRVGKRVRRLLKEIEKLAALENLSIQTISRDQIREVFEQFGATTKYEISKLLTSYFPELEHKIPKPRKIWEGEDRNMAIFDALSLAVTWYYLN